MREREREYKQCHSVQEAMLQSTLPRHESTSPATKRLRVSAEVFLLSSLYVMRSETHLYVYLYFLFILIHLVHCNVLCLPLHKGRILLR